MTPASWPVQYVYEQAPEDPRGGSRCEDREMARNYGKSFCCGAGGASMWMEEHGDRINDARAKQAIDVNADTSPSAVPSVSP